MAKNEGFLTSHITAGAFISSVSWKRQWPCFRRGTYASGEMS